MPERYDIPFTDPAVRQQFLSFCVSVGNPRVSFRNAYRPEGGKHLSFDNLQTPLGNARFADIGGYGMTYDECAKEIFTEIWRPCVKDGKLLILNFSTQNRKDYSVAGEPDSLVPKLVMEYNLPRHRNNPPLRNPYAARNYE